MSLRPGHGMLGGEPQIHGTQYQVRGGVLELWPVRDPRRLGAGRRTADDGVAAKVINRCRSRPGALHGATRIA